jgi:exopolysaccharide biosynthesis polyprenyl glycosylphosphotransferase
MSRKKELILLFISDFIAINGAWVLLYLVRTQTHFFYAQPSFKDAGDVASASMVVYFFWMIAFLFFGLYRSWYVRPIFDEVVTVLKTLGIGTIVFVFFVLWGPSAGAEEHALRNDPRIIGLLYFGILATTVITLRLFFRFSQHKLLESGIGRRTSLILGEPDKALELATQLAQFPRLGYEVIGFVSTNGKSEFTSENTTNLKLLGNVDALESIIHQNGVREVLITMNSGDHTMLLDVIGRTVGENVGLKIVPDLYDIVSGQARTREIYGFPLLDINPELQRPWENTAKRIMDIGISLFGVIVGLPLWIVVGIMVKLTSKGPMIYKQERVGMDGEHFYIYKFRSMRTDAETAGPQWATKNDPRVTMIGRFMRKTHLDEGPQLWNILRGDMSMVGPRPERPHFVELLSQEIPYYKRRLRVRPGLTGLFQATEYKYDESIEDVKYKLKYDLMYIESMSFRLDIKILLWTAYKILRGKGHT